jgi:DNA polymerase III epsilon subunit family exonuclease
MPSQPVQSPLSSLAIDEADFLVVDVETTGLSATNGDRVCEVGAVKLRGGAIIETFGTLVDPRRPVSSGAYAVNGISPQMLLDAPVFPTIAGKLWAMMESAILVAYNAPFDFSFLSSEFRLAGYPPILNNVVDALALARQLLPGLERYGQDVVARTAGVAPTVNHRALDDALITAQLFVLFSSILKAHDCTTCADLQRRNLSAMLCSKRIGTIDQALQTRSNLWIRYLSARRSEISSRIVTPREYVTDGSRGRTPTHLLAYCHTAQSERNFRLDRILDVRVVGAVPV